ncbi:MAG: isocitrate lyase/phosphoenolpyruvate mutase family protein [Rhodospirillaceae bacterium]|nr:isocitrate lyase/phosphoenolpyruvate mutase family protein [Rhodospirillaceae bacterium]
MPPTPAQKRATFFTLHQSGCFVIPNPFDVGSAKYLQHLGFKALATTSAGFAWSHGVADNKVTRDMVLAHLRDIVGAVDVPVNADFEGGFAHDPAGVADNVKRAVETGVAGLSIEDFNGNPSDPLYAFDDAVARIKAARKAIDETGANVILTARTEGYCFGRPDLAETIKRLKAFADAGADCVFAPAMKSLSEIEELVNAVAPTPVNVGGAVFGWSVEKLSALGVRRISLGVGLARAAWTDFMRVAHSVAETGSFDAFGTVTKTDFNAFFNSSSS